MTISSYSDDDVREQMRRNSRYIRGYIVPPYEMDGQVYSEDTPLRVIVDDVIMGRLGNGVQREKNIYNIVQGLVNQRLTGSK